MAEVLAYERSHEGDMPGSYIDAAHFVFLPAIDEEIERLRALPAPAGDERYVDQLLYAQKAALDSAAVQPSLPSVKAAERYFAKSGKRLRAYGLSSCALG